MRDRYRSKIRRLRPLLAALLAALAAAACQSNYYDEYLRAHPGWDAEFPREDAKLEEVLAALHARSRVSGVELELVDLEILRAEADLWRAIRFESIRSGSVRSSDGDRYLVLVTARCRFEQGLRVGGEQRHAYYVLHGNSLVAWDHYAFGEACAVSDRFRAARGEVLPDEREALRRLAKRGPSRVGLAQAYRRGLAFVEAGRLTEAQAMLAFGERGFHASTSRLRRGDRAPESLLEAGRLRSALMRALGVEGK